MAAARTESTSVALRDIVEQKSRQQTTRSDDLDGTDTVFTCIFEDWAGRCSSLCRERDVAAGAHSPPTSKWISTQSEPLSSKLLACLERPAATEHSPSPYGTPPPSYAEAILDAPPDYTSTELLAQAHPHPQNTPQPPSNTRRAKGHSNLDQLWPMPQPNVDFRGSSNFVTHGKKKKKAVSDWTDTPADEGGNDAGNGQEGDANGEGAAGGEGGGGAGDNNGDGGADDWNVGGGKKNKKKGKKAVEEEEKRKREEEAAAAAAAQVKGEKEEAFADPAGNFSCADDAHADADGHDDFGLLSTKKGKKGEDAHADAGDDLGITTSKKKGKKDKKSKNDNSDSVPPDTVTTGTFDEVNLLDDSAPTIDISFGDAGTKETSSSFGFSNWGKWGAAAASSWDFGGLGTTSTDVAESKSSKDSAKDTNPTSAGSTDASTWSFGGNKKNKKKTTTSGFNFRDFDELDKVQEEPKALTELPKPEEDATPWGGFTSVNKQEKKKKKGAIEETVERAIAVLPEITETAADEPWGTWGTGKKKTKASNSNDVPPPPPAGTVLPPPPTEPEQPLAEDDWGGWGTKKIKKKGNKANAEVPKVGGSNPEEPVAAAAVVVVPEREAEPPWAFTSKKGMRQGTKAAWEEPKIEVPEAEEHVAAAAVVVVLEPEADTSWGLSSKKSKKKATKTAWEESKTEDPGPEEHVVDAKVIVVPEPETESPWDFAAKKEKKNKLKGGTGEVKAEVSAVEIVPDPEPVWGSGRAAGTSKKGMKGAKNDPIVSIPPENKDNDAEEDLHGGWGTTTKKKGAKKFEGPGIVEVPEKDAADDVLDMWGSTDKKKISKKADGSRIVEGPEKQDVIEDTYGIWGSNKKKASKKADGPTIADVSEQKYTVQDASEPWGSASKKDKKPKKSSFFSFEDDDPGPIEGEEGVAAPANEPETDWMDWGASKTKPKKKGGAAKEDEPEDFPPPPPPTATISVDTPKQDASSKKGKDKKGKKGKATEPTPEPEPEPEAILVPEVQEVVPDEPPKDDWDAYLSPKDRKKKEKEREKEAKRKAAEELKEEERIKDEERIREEERIKEEERLAEEKRNREADSKKKPGRKPVGEAASTSKTKDLMAGSVPDTFSTLDDDTWGLGGWGSTNKSKKKGASSNLMDFEIPPAAPTPPAMGLTPDPEENEPAQDDWGSFTGNKSKDKKGAKSANLTRTTSKASDFKAGVKGGTDKSADLLSTLDWSDDTQEAQTEPTKEETPAKAAKSFWSSIGGGTVNAKPKTKRELEREKVDEKAAAEAAEREAQAREDAELEELLGAVDSEVDSEPEPEPEPEPLPPPPKSASKLKAGGKLSRASSKGSDKLSKVEKSKGEIETLVDIVEETPRELEDGKKFNGGDAKGTSDDKAGDGWSLFGTLKKPPVKKGDEVKKEITKSDLTNQKAATKNGSNDPEEVEADEAEESKQPPKSSKMSATRASLTNSKGGKLSVAEKIKALEKDKAISKPEPTPPPPLAPPAPEPQLKEAKPKLTRTPGSFSKKKDLSPTNTKDDLKKSSKDSVPGSFPSEERDDDIVDIIEVPPPEKKSKGKAGKAKKTPKETEMDDMIVEAPAPPPAPPTPPPEPVAPKSAKKERARVVRDEASPSWGFWGSTPKKDVKKAAGKSKDDNDVAPSTPKEKVSAPGLSRSKSTKTPREKETEELSRSSASDKDKDKAVESPRPTPKARNSGFASLFGGPSPARTKSVRRSSTIAAPKDSSRRRTVDVGGSGMPSPPLDDEPEISGKAAKLMGIGSGKLDRKASTRGKQKVKAIPDPYAIGDDDMVMVNPVEDPVINAPLPKRSSKDPRKDKVATSKSTRETREQSPQRVYPPSGGVYLPDRTKAPKESSNGKFRKSKYEPEAADDIVMVEAGPSTGSPEIITGPDDMAFVEKPRERPPLKRSATSAKRSDGLKGLFGFRKTRRASDPYDRPKTRTVYADEEIPSRRKRSAVDGGDGVKRPRRDDRSRRRGEKRDADADGGFVTDAAPNGGASTEAEDAEARREERRARRAEKESPSREARRAELRKLEEKQARNSLNDKAATEARKAKIREARDREARAKEDKENRRYDDREARRMEEEEERLEDEDEVPRDLDPIPTTERRSKHRSSRGVDEPPSRHRSERRRSHMDTPISSRTADEDAERRARRHSRRNPPEKPPSSRRKSAPVDDYFDPRNGSRNAPAVDDPYIHSGTTDHTSTWVNSQITEPPPPPPIEPTVIEPPPVLGPEVGDDDLEETRRAKRKTSRRRSRYVDGVGEEEGERPRRRREREVRSSEGSDGARKGGGVKSPAGVRSPAGARSPDGGGRRASWFKRVTNL